MESTYSILSEEEIKKRQLVHSPPGDTPHADLFERTSVNLSIGSFLPDLPGPDKSHRRLKPQEMVWALSKEVVALPSDVTGYVTGKRSLAAQGIMAINTGMIDPTFVGPISVILVNFSDRPQDLDLGNVFVKVIFHNHPPVTGEPYCAPYKACEHAAIVEKFTELRAKEARKFAPTFLNLEGHSQEIGNAVGLRIVRSAVVQATIAGALLAVLAVFLPIGAQMVREPRADSAEVAALREQLNQVLKDIADMKAREKR